MISSRFDMMLKFQIMMWSHTHSLSLSLTHSLTHSHTLTHSLTHLQGAAHGGVVPQENVHKAADSVGADKGTCL